METTTLAANLCKGELLGGSVSCTIAAEVSEAAQGFVLSAIKNLLTTKLI